MMTFIPEIRMTISITAPAARAVRRASTPKASYTNLITSAVGITDNAIPDPPTDHRMVGLKQ